MGCKGSRVQISASRPSSLPQLPVTNTPIRFCLDGRWLAPGEAAFAPTSGLVRSGEGWFETMRVEDGRPMFLAAHLERLSLAIASGLGDEQARRALHAARRCLTTMEPSFRDVPVGRLRLLLALDAAGDAWQALGEWGPYEAQPAALASGIVAVTAALPHPGLGPLGKSASYHWSMAARREALARGADEALLARDGRILEAATGALVWRHAGRWFTEDSPAVLSSVTVDALRACGVAIAPGELPAGSLASSALEGLLLVSALRLVVAVREVDGRGIATAMSLPTAREWRDALLGRHGGGR